MFCTLPSSFFSRDFFRDFSGTFSGTMRDAASRVVTEHGSGE